MEDGRVVEVDGPAVGSGHSGVEVGVGVGQPDGTLVVEVGKRAAGQVFGWQGRVAVSVGGVEPTLAQLVEAGGGDGNSFALGVVGFREGEGRLRWSSLS